MINTIKDLITSPSTSPLQEKIELITHRYQSGIRPHLDIMFNEVMASQDHNAEEVVITLRGRERVSLHKISMDAFLTKSTYDIVASLMKETRNGHHGTSNETQETGNGHHGTVLPDSAS